MAPKLRLVVKQDLFTWVFEFFCGIDKYVGASLWTARWGLEYYGAGDGYCYGECDGGYGCIVCFV